MITVVSTTMLISQGPTPPKANTALITVTGASQPAQNQWYRPHRSLLLQECSGWLVLEKLNGKAYCALPELQETAARAVDKRQTTEARERFSKRPGNFRTRKALLCCVVMGIKGSL
jgi:hypothetical protein